jgi:hypothetical protein
MEIKSKLIERVTIECDFSDNFVYISFKMKPFNNKIDNLTIAGSPNMRFKLM